MSENYIELTVNDMVRIEISICLNKIMDMQQKYSTLLNEDEKEIMDMVRFYFSRIDREIHYHVKEKAKPVFDIHTLVIIKNALMELRDTLWLEFQIKQCDRVLDQVNVEIKKVAERDEHNEYL